MQWRSSARWRLFWTSPKETDTVFVHLAANAANGDDSALGDLIHVDEVIIQSEPR